MDTKFFEEYQDKLLDFQKNFFDTWLKNMGDAKLPEAWDKSVEVQEKMVENYLEAQETASKLVLDAQKKMWNQYFETLNKKPVATVA